MKQVSLLLTALVLAISGAQAITIYAPQPKVHVPIAPATYAVTSTSNAASGVQANSNRSGIECTNTGSNTVYAMQAGSAASAVAGKGTAIPANTMWYADDYNFHQGAIVFVTASGVVSTMSCQEYQ